MLKKILQYILYGAFVLGILQYLLVGIISPKTLLADLKTCLLTPTLCPSKNRDNNDQFYFSDLRKDTAVLDTLLVTESESERNTLSSAFEVDVVDFTNKERISRSLPPLTPQPLLAKSAHIKAFDMYKRQYFEHDSPDGKGVSDLVSEAEYQYLIVGENLALGDFKNAQDVVNAWMNSKGHRENILNPKYREIGVSMVSGTYNGKDALFIVQHFGTSRAICPEIETRLKNTIDEMSQTLRGDEREIERLKDVIESEKNIFSAEYAKNVATFNALIEKYNNLLEESRIQITQYNKEVRAFNECLVQFQ